MKVENIAWCLPRPRKRNKYIGGFPLYFEEMLMRELGYPSTVLHPFGGMAEIGLRVDLKRKVKPDIVGDAHTLPFRDNQFGATVLDSPYSVKYSKRLYQGSKVHYSKFVEEAVRVTRELGFVVVYHMIATPTPRHTVLVKRILIETRLSHVARIVHVNLKDSKLYKVSGEGEIDNDVIRETFDNKKLTEVFN